MTKLAVIALLIPLLTGCALFTKPADTVSVPRGQAWIVYTNLRVSYAELKIKLDAACKDKRLEAEFCGELARKHDEMMRLDKKLVKVLTTPATELDWEAIGEAAQLVVGLALKAI